MKAIELIQEAEPKINQNKIMMSDFSIKDLMELITAIIGSQKSGGDISELVKVLALRETLQALRQPPAPTPQPAQQSDMFSQMMQFAMAMKFWDLLERKFGKSESVDDFLKYMQMFQAMSKGQIDAATLIQMINETHNRYAQLMKEQYENKLKESEEKWQQILNIIQEVMQRWDREKLEMFQRFEETIKELQSKGRFDELKKFLEEYQEYRQLEKQLKELLHETELEKAPITTKEGGINWEKLLYYVDKWLFGGGVSKPEKKQITPPPILQPQPKQEQLSPPMPQEALGKIEPQPQPKEELPPPLPEGAEEKIEVAGETKKEE